MHINRKRIINVEPYLKAFAENELVVVGLSDLARHEARISQMGIPQPYQNGQTILPASIFGPVSLFNAEGKQIARKDLPMETAYREVEWHWEQWNGKNSTIAKSKIADVPYKRYPREFVAPPSIELSIQTNSSGQMFLLSPKLENNLSNFTTIKHIINLFLEIFGECELLTESIERITRPELIRLNWELLPRGEMPWEQVKQSIEPLIKKAPKGVQPVLEYRLETINRLNPDFRAVGKGGFRGYIVHGFSNKNLYILESMYYGNATYVFGDSWEILSKRTKAEILNQHLQKDRIVHIKGWKQKVTNLIENGRR